MRVLPPSSRGPPRTSLRGPKGPEAIFRSTSPSSVIARVQQARAPSLRGAQRRSNPPNPPHNRSSSSLRNRPTCQTLSHSRLPPRPSGPPTLNHFRGKPQADQLPALCGPRSAALLHNGPLKHFFGEFWKLLVLIGFHLVRVHPSQVRLQSRVRGVFAHDDWPFAC